MAKQCAQLWFSKNSGNYRMTLGCSPNDQSVPALYLHCVGNQIHDRNDFKEAKVYFGSQFEGCLRSMVVGKTKVCDKSLSHVVDQKAQHSDQNHKQEPSKFCPQ